MSSEALVLDLDGTLIRNDLTHELIILCLRWKPHLLPIAIFKLLMSRSEGKRFLAELFHPLLDASVLPYNQEVLDLARDYKARGHKIEIVSGSDQLIVQKVGHFLESDLAAGSQPGRNLTSKNKADFLMERHAGNFVYAGNSKADYPVWRVAKKGYAVNAPARSLKLSRENGDQVPVERLVQNKQTFRPLIKAMRLHQWAKNSLIFLVPGLFITQLGQSDWLSLLAAFLCFSIMASATYILNDLFDIQDDRTHRTKFKRPLARGDLALPIAILFVLLVIPLTLQASLMISLSFAFVLASYTLITLAYSFRLKRMAVLDVFILASLFTIRVVAGAYVIGKPPSSWLLCFVGCFFLALAIGKRYIEVQGLQAKSTEQVSGRGYQARDEYVLLAFGSATGFASVIALLIYGLLAPTIVFNFDISVYFCSAILAAWMFRFWLLAGRGELNDDPVVFAIKDQVSFITLSTIALIFLFDITRPLWITLY